MVDYGVGSVYELMHWAFVVGNGNGNVFDVDPSVMVEVRLILSAGFLYPLWEIHDGPYLVGTGVDLYPGSCFEPDLLDLDP